MPEISYHSRSLLAAAPFGAAAAGVAGVDFFSSGDWTWNLFPATGDVGFRRGDFTWNGEPTFTVAIFSLQKALFKKSLKT